MPDAVREGDDRPRRLGHVPDIGRAADLVVDDRDLVTLAADPQHRPHEVVAGRAEEPGRADDPRLFTGGGLAVGLRTAVGRERIRRVRLDVRRAPTPVEDVVARVVDERAEPGSVLRSADVDCGRALRVILRAVHVRPGGGVQHEIEATGETVRRRLRNVPVGA